MSFYIVLRPKKWLFIFGLYIFGKYNGRSRRAVSQGNDSCDAEVSSATPSTYMVGPMFLVSLHHIFIMLRGYTETCYIKRVMLDKGDRKLWF